MNWLTLLRFLAPYILFVTTHTFDKYLRKYSLHQRKKRRTTALEFRPPYVDESTPCEAARSSTTVKNLCSLLANLPNQYDRALFRVPF